MCHMSHVTCHVSCVTCHLSHVTCKKIITIFYKKQINKYQRGLPRLVMKGAGAGVIQGARSYVWQGEGAGVLKRPGRRKKQVPEKLQEALSQWARRSAPLDLIYSVSVFNRRNKNHQDMISNFKLWIMNIYLKNLTCYVSTCLIGGSCTDWDDTGIYQIW